MGGPGIAQQVHALALRAYDLIIGLELGDVAVDGCITKAPCAGSVRAGPSPVDRRKGGLKRSVATEDYGIPLGDRLRGREPDEPGLPVVAEERFPTAATPTRVEPLASSRCP